MDAPYLLYSRKEEPHFNTMQTQAARMGWKTTALNPAGKARVIDAEGIEVGEFTPEEFLDYMERNEASYR